MDHPWDSPVQEIQELDFIILVGPFQLAIFYDKKLFQNLETEFLYLIVTFYFWCRTPVVFTEPGNTQKILRGGHSSPVWQLVPNVKFPGAAEQFPLFADSVPAFPSQHWQQLLGISVKWPRAVGQTGIPQEYSKRRLPGKGNLDLELTSADLLKEERLMTKYKSLSCSALLNIQPLNVNFPFFYKLTFQPPAPISGCITLHPVLPMYKEQILVYEYIFSSSNA